MGKKTNEFYVRHSTNLVSNTLTHKRIIINSYPEHSKQHGTHFNIRVLKYGKWCCHIQNVLLKRCKMHSPEPLIGVYTCIHTCIHSLQFGHWLRGIPVSEPRLKLPIADEIFIHYTPCLGPVCVCWHIAKSRASVSTFVCMWKSHRNLI